MHQLQGLVLFLCGTVEALRQGQGQGSTVPAARLATLRTQVEEIRRLTEQMQAQITALAGQ